MNSNRFPKRSTAYKLNIEDIKAGDFYIENKEDKKISYIRTPFGLEVSRVRILGDVVFVRSYDDEATGNVKSVYLGINDGTESILVRAFLESQYNTKYLDSIQIAKELEVGNIVDIVGRVRKRENTIYINPEIIKKIEDPNFETLRELEKIYLKMIKKKDREAPSFKEVKFDLEVNQETQDLDMEDLEEYEDLETSLTLASSQESDDSITKILSLIEKIDEGDGVTIEEISTYTNIDNDKLKSILKVLFEDGTIYEPKSGRFRKL
ncbi:MAG: hypothetical protein EAX96_08715 [Candidatus Lokiarchaeota archaeon]|nr:hypothetical protein [Candidatus Lokiarchaeota archaeon]